MRVLRSLLALAPAVAAEFIPGGSFGRTTIGPYNNCSGTLTTRPTDVAIDTLPNINPNSPSGWERWDLTIYQSDIFLNLRWLQGDPASYNSVPADGSFEVSARFTNGTIFYTRITGEKLTYTNSSPYSITIGQNTLTWDDSQTWFNTTLNLNGVTGSFGTQSIMLDKFSPYAGWIIGQLTEGLFSGIPVTRGHTHVGSIQFPSGQTVNLTAQSVLLHMFAEQPVQSLAVNYGIRAFRSTGTTFGDTFIYENSRAPNSSEYNAFFLGRAEIRGTEYVPYTFYAGTNSNLLSINQINRTSTEAQLAGCANTDYVPFTWNYTLPLPALEQFDSAGGKTTLYVFNNISTAEPFGSEYVSYQGGTGIAYIYQTPGAAAIDQQPSSGGQPPEQ
ncbi:hypothetical protein EDD16DRAFT_1603688 [Pisolithus croceorrhizus]|nr:hypothetical protein EDD16DRAFT_1603688 [Pisolithus croceorrhizus]KAI6125937.1 hypothetical protein EV401DRAFT_1935916 [Pisolithus croceorrhizus]KAI6169736.1 hypothetical protein EDD17DRAFT_1520787 [Pisolithus thermaeus]